MLDVNILVAFGSGLVSFFAPCVLPLLPAYLGYISGASVQELGQKQNWGRYRTRLIQSAGLYVLGFSLVFVVLGTTAAGFGSIFRQHTRLIQRLGGVVVMLFALQFLGVWRGSAFKSFQIGRMPAWFGRLRHGRAFLMGMVFATAWTPCIGAVLGAILTLAAASQTVAVGAFLLFVYSLGISVPFLLLAGFMARVPQTIQQLERYVPWVQKVGGGLLLVIGFLLFNNTLKWFAPWLTYDALNGWLFAWAYRWGYTVN